MESHADFLWYLAVLSCRSLGLACLTWLALRVCRVKSASVKHAAWTVVTGVMLLQVVASPALPSVPLRVLAPVQDAGPSPGPQLVLSPIRVQASDRHLAFTWRQVVIGIYAAVAFALLVQLTLGYMFARRLVRNSKPVDGPRVRESESISVPVTVGQVAPAILLPIDWREWDSAKLQAVLAHEEAHVRRADWAIGVMARINCCVFWFHPLAWWLRRQLALLAEFACDDLVLGQVGDRQEYARALFEIACAMKSAQGRFIGVAVSMAKETNVQKRMDHILDQTRPIPPAFGRSGWVTLLVCGLPLAYLASAVQLARAQTVMAQARTVAPRQLPLQTPTPDASPYQKWLDEEVVYLISEDERRAFLRLTTDDERQQFITQFWLRRDPTPATEENEMKEEHYRRIAFANDHFAESIPGWKTDRGAIYIKYGPPDAIDSHGATPSTYPYEKWRYRYIEGMGTNVELEFVDPTMTGRYHLTRDPSEKDSRR
jgi:GWxTD domain-containing protein